MNECGFCEVIKNKDRLIYENKYFFAIFDRNPVSPGHALIIPKRHIASILDLTSEEWKFLKPMIINIIKLIEKTDFKGLYEKLLENLNNEKTKWFLKEALKHEGINRKPDGYNIGVNEGEAAGRTIRHLHVHIIPRFKGDVKDYVGGVRHIIPGKGNYKELES